MGPGRLFALGFGGGDADAGARDGDEGPFSQFGRAADEMKQAVGEMAENGNAEPVDFRELRVTMDQLHELAGEIDLDELEDWKDRGR